MRRGFPMNASAVLVVVDTLTLILPSSLFR
jgi:hypothetical protein